MTLKKLGLLTAFCLTLVLYGCGGGGGSNPVASSTEPVVDLTLPTAYPSVYTSYSSMQTALQGNTNPTVQVANFMVSIGPDFVSAAGTPASSSIEATTLDRLTRYTVNSYKFIPTAHEVIGTDTLKVTTYMSIDVTRKPGAVGGYEKASTVISPSPVIIWKNYGTEAAGNWKIQQGLPYLSSEISF